MAEEKQTNESTENDPMKSMLEKLFNCNKKKTPSEKIVHCAKERDLIFDQITIKKMELEKAEARKDDDDIAFIKKQMKLLNEQKAMLTERIKKLLDLT